MADERVEPGPPTGLENPRDRTARARLAAEAVDRRGRKGHESRVGKKARRPRQPRRVGLEDLGHRTLPDSLPQRPRDAASRLKGHDLAAIMSPEHVTYAPGPDLQLGRASCR